MSEETGATTVEDYLATQAVADPPPPADEPQNQGVEQDPPPVVDEPTAGSQTDDAPPKETPPEPEIQAGDVDSEGIPWANREIELKRKKDDLKAKETKWNKERIAQGLDPFSDAGLDLPPPELPAPPETIQQPPAAAQQTTETPYEDMTIEQVIEKSKEEGRIAARQETQALLNARDTQTRILNEYPTMNNPKSPQYQWMLHFLANDFNNNPNYVEYATIKAAQQIGIIPKSMQKTNPNPKPLHQKQPPGMVTETPAQRQTKPKSKLTSANLRFAEALGQDINDLEKYA